MYVCLHESVYIGHPFQHRCILAWFLGFFLSLKSQLVTQKLGQISWQTFTLSVTQTWTLGLGCLYHGHGHGHGYNCEPLNLRVRCARACGILLIKKNRLQPVYKDIKKSYTSLYYSRSKVNPKVIHYPRFTATPQQRHKGSQHAQVHSLNLPFIETTHAALIFFAGHCCLLLLRWAVFLLLCSQASCFYPVKAYEDCCLLTSNFSRAFLTRISTIASVAAQQNGVCKSLSYTVGGTGICKGFSKNSKQCLTQSMADMSSASLQEVQLRIWLALSLLSWPLRYLFMRIIYAKSRCFVTSWHDLVFAQFLDKSSDGLTEDTCSATYKSVCNMLQGTFKPSVSIPWRLILSDSFTRIGIYYTCII